MTNEDRKKMRFSKKKDRAARKAARKRALRAQEVNPREVHHEQVSGHLSKRTVAERGRLLCRARFRDEQDIDVITYEPAGIEEFIPSPVYDHVIDLRDSVAYGYDLDEDEAVYLGNTLSFA